MPEGRLPSAQKVGELTCQYFEVIVKKRLQDNLLNPKNVRFLRTDKKHPTHE
jgi:hypothetical protein